MHLNKLLNEYETKVNVTLKANMIFPKPRKRTKKKIKKRAIKTVGDIEK